MMVARGYSALPVPYTEITMKMGNTRNSERGCVPHRGPAEHLQWGHSRIPEHLAFLLPLCKTEK